VRCLLFSILVCLLFSILSSIAVSNMWARKQVTIDCRGEEVLISEDVKLQLFNGAPFLHEDEEYKIAETALAFVCLHSAYFKDGAHEGGGDDRRRSDGSSGDMGCGTGRGRIVREVFEQCAIDIAAKDVGKHVKFPPGFALEVLLQEVQEEPQQSYAPACARHSDGDCACEVDASGRGGVGGGAAGGGAGGLLGAFLFGKRDKHAGGSRRRRSSGGSEALVATRRVSHVASLPWLEDDADAALPDHAAWSGGTETGGGKHLLPHVGVCSGPSEVHGAGGGWEGLQTPCKGPSRWAVFSPVSGTSQLASSVHTPCLTRSAQARRRDTQDPLLIHTLALVPASSQDALARLHQRGEEGGEWVQGGRRKTQQVSLRNPLGRFSVSGFLASSAPAGIQEHPLSALETLETLETPTALLLSPLGLMAYERQASLTQATIQAKKCARPSSLVLSHTCMHTRAFMDGNMCGHANTDSSDLAAEARRGLTPQVLWHQQQGVRHAPGRPRTRHLRRPTRSARGRQRGARWPDLPPRSLVAEASPCGRGHLCCAAAVGPTAAAARRDLRGGQDGARQRRLAHARRVPRAGQRVW
jgi:hypothetical protein